MTPDDLAPGTAFCHAMNAGWSVPTAGASLTLRYDIVIADGALDPAACARLAEHAGLRDLLLAWE